MQPLVLALRGGNDLVSQGLRTLELCIDNLTPDFLDPTLNTVLRDLMEALHDLLKPVPANHHHAHTTIRILGKLGGRNRKLLDQEPLLDYRQYSDPAKIRVSFSGNVTSLSLAPVSKLALKTIKKPPATVPANSKVQYQGYAYNYLESCLSVLVQDVRSFRPHHGQDILIPKIGDEGSRSRRGFRTVSGRSIRRGAHP